MHRNWSTTVLNPSRQRIITSIQIQRISILEIYRQYLSRVILKYLEYKYYNYIFVCSEKMLP